MKLRPAKFHSDLDTRLHDEHRGLDMLRGPLVYYSAILGKEIIVPFGFITDYASVPRIVGAYLLFGGKGKRAAVIHDWLYSGGVAGVTRKMADDIFLEALEATGYYAATRWPMYLGVRLGGWVAYQKPNQAQPIHVAKILEREAA
jgi:hypothetical protein